VYDLARQFAGMGGAEVKQRVQRVPDTRFGDWFQRTGIWQRYVVEPALEELHRLLLAHADAKGFERMLDAGCGAGVAFPAIESRFRPRRITAIEIDAQMAAAARASAVRCACEIEVVEADVEDLCFADASFDAVLCHQTLHHVNQQAAVLRTFRRLLRPGGVLLLAESCRRFTQSFAVRALFRHPRTGHRSSEEFVGLVRDAGFELRPDEISHPDPFWARTDFGLTERITGRPRPPGAPTQLNLVARRPAESSAR
jgi:SAM-dependent methyltransferase